MKLELMLCLALTATGCSTKIDGSDIAQTCADIFSYLLDDQVCAACVYDTENVTCSCSRWIECVDWVTSMGDYGLEIFQKVCPLAMSFCDAEPTNLRYIKDICIVPQLSE